MLVPLLVASIILEAFRLAVNSAGDFFSPGAACLLAGGDDGARTRDLVVANHALSQLSYIPEGAVASSGRTWSRTKDLSFIRAAL